MLRKARKAKENFGDNPFHNAVRLFDVLRNFLFTTGETMGDYHLKVWYMGIASRVPKRLKT